MRDLHRWLIPDPEFNQFMYHCMCNAPLHILEGLDQDDLLLFRDTRTKKKFAEESSLEQKLMLLAKLGVSYCIVAAQEDVDSMPALAEMTHESQFFKKKLTLTDVMARDKMFVLSSREVLVSAHMAAIQAHSKVYQLNAHHLNSYHKLKDAEVVLNREDKTADAKEAFDTLGLLILRLMQGQDTVQTISGISEYEMRVLIALHTKRHTYVATTQLAAMVGNTTVKAITKSCSLLEKKGYLHTRRFRPTPSTRVYKVLIMEPGIEAVHRWIKYLVRRMDVED